MSTIRDAPRYLAALLALCSACGSASTSGDPIAVTVEPSAVTLPAGGRQAFTAAVTAATTSVTWSVLEGGPGGTVTGVGLYTAPASAGTFHVVATSVADPARSGSAVITVVAQGTYITPTPVTGDVVVSADSHTTRAISPFLYGLNFAELGGPDGPGVIGAGRSGMWIQAMPRYGINRFGGNRLTAFNWETGYSNCGNDCGPTFPNDANLLENVGVSPGIGAAVRPRVDIPLAAGAATVLTIPVIGYVAADLAGATAPLPAAPNQDTPADLSGSSRWKQALPHNPAGATATPDTRDGFVYSDDFAKWLEASYPGKLASGDIQLELDNETDIWGSTHQEVRGVVTGGPSGTDRVSTGFDELVNKTIAHAQAVKAVAPAARIWFAAFAGFDGMVQLNYPAHQAPPAGYTYYLDYLLQKLKAASDARGSRIAEVFDQHWYVQNGNITNDYATQTATVVAQRVQASRSLWDPRYVSPNDWVPGSIPVADQYNCAGGACPIDLLHRIQRRIDTFFPGTQIAIGEYWYGRGGDISSTIVNADVLGIFATAGIYAATMWPNGNIWAYDGPNSCAGSWACAANHGYQCALRAIDVYRNYDGAGGSFGDTLIGTTVADPAFTLPASQDERVTAYTGMLAGDPGRVAVVAINKTASAALNVAFRVTHTSAFSRVSAWRTTGVNGGAGGCTTAPLADVTLTATNAFNAILPGQSVTVFLLSP